MIDEVAVFEQAFGAQQIAALYDAGRAGGLQSLVDDGSTAAAPAGGVPAAVSRGAG